MKKLLISLCAVSLWIAASGVSYAGRVTFVNYSNQPVTFALSSGVVYNPIFKGTLLGGQHTTIFTYGPLTPDNTIMAYSPVQSSIVTNCGRIVYPLNDIIVRAGWSQRSGQFGCFVTTVLPYYPLHKRHHPCHKTHYHAHHYKHGGYAVIR